MGIDGRSVENLSYQAAVDLLRNIPSQVTLLVSQPAVKKEHNPGQEHSQVKEHSGSLEECSTKAKREHSGVLRGSSSSQPTSLREHSQKVHEHSKGRKGYSSQPTSLKEHKEDSESTQEHPIPIMDLSRSIKEHSTHPSGKKEYFFIHSTGISEDTSHPSLRKEHLTQLKSKTEHSTYPSLKKENISQSKSIKEHSTHPSGKKEHSLHIRSMTEPLMGLKVYAGPAQEEGGNSVVGGSTISTSITHTRQERGKLLLLLLLRGYKMEGY